MAHADPPPYTTGDRKRAASLERTPSPKSDSNVATTLSKECNVAPQTSSKGTPTLVISESKEETKKTEDQQEQYKLDDDIIPLDKHDKDKLAVPSRPGAPVRSGSLRRMMSTSSMQSLKRGIGTLRRKLTRKHSRVDMLKDSEKVHHEPLQRSMTDPTLSANGDQTDPLDPFIHGVGSFKGPKRVETYQVCSMAY